MVRDIFPQPGDRLRQLVRSSGRLAEPERNGGCHALRVLDADDAAFHAPDLVAPVAELKNVAGKAFNGEILVHRSNEAVFGLKQDLVVGVVGDSTASGQRGQARAAPAAQHAIHGVVVEQRTAPAPARAEALRQHVDDRGKVVARQFSIRPGAPYQREQLILPPLAACHFGHDLLRQDVQRLVGNDETIELAAANAVEQSRAFDQLVARQRKQSPLGRTSDRMTGPTHPLQESCDRAGRTELAHKIDVTNVDAELKRCRCNERLQLPVLQSLLSLKPLFLGEAAVVSGHVRLTQQLGEFPRRPLGHPPGIDEHQCRAVLLDQCREAPIDLIPHLRRHHRF